VRQYDRPSELSRKTVRFAQDADPVWIKSWLRLKPQRGADDIRGPVMRAHLGLIGGGADAANAPRSKTVEDECRIAPLVEPPCPVLLPSGNSATAVQHDDNGERSRAGR
jgi:hypothetical protein